MTAAAELAGLGLAAVVERGVTVNADSHSGIRRIARGMRPGGILILLTLLAALAIGLVLGPIAEPYFRRTLVKSLGEYTVFIDRPVSAILVVASVVAFTLPLLEQTEFGQRIRERLGLANMEDEQ